MDEILSSGALPEGWNDERGVITDAEAERIAGRALANRQVAREAGPPDKHDLARFTYSATAEGARRANRPPSSEGLPQDYGRA